MNDSMEELNMLHNYEIEKIPRKVYEHLCDNYLASLRYCALEVISTC